MARAGNGALHLDVEARLIAPHRGGEIPDYHEFVVLTGHAVELRDSLGRPHRNAWRPWLRVVCNNPGCEGMAMVDCVELGKVMTEATT